MKNFFLSFLYIVAVFAAMVLVLSAMLLIEYSFGSGGPGDILLWVRQPRVFMVLITLATLLLFKVVRVDGQKVFLKLLEKATEVFEKL